MDENSELLENLVFKSTLRVACPQSFPEVQNFRPQLHRLNNNNKLCKPYYLFPGSLRELRNNNNKEMCDNKSRLW